LCRATFQRYRADEEKWSRTPDKRIGSLANFHRGELRSRRSQAMNIQRRRFLGSSLGPGISERFSSRGDAFGDYDTDGDIDALLLL